MLYLLTQAIDRAAERAPDQVAIRFSGQQLTYAELSDRSDQLARTLVANGVQRGDRVAIFAGKSLASAVAIYGIMKAGAAYVPLDPTAPLVRLAFILRDGAIRHVVTEPARLRTLRDLLPLSVPLECAIGLECPGDLPIRSFSWAEVLEANRSVRLPSVMEQDLSYILYTSGSTGVPKGVMHTHRSALSFAEIATSTYGLRSDDRLTNYAPLHFDLSTLDFFGAGVVGATTVIIPEAHMKLPASLAKLLEDERLTLFYTVPFALVQLLLHGALEKRDLRSLRWVLFGGEMIARKYLRELRALLPGALFSNVYGPTETNGCTFYPVPTSLENSDEPIPIGRPFGNVEALIVDEADRPVVPGQPGELLIRSPTMMRGYWARPDLNALGFFRRSVFSHYEDVFYRTGDLVRQQPDGDLAFLGRMDRQVKVRGYRVELDEIESVLTSHPSVEVAAVFVVTDSNGGQHIEASVVGMVGTELSPAELASHLAAYVPGYAIPERIDILTELPRTSSGKIDRVRLRAQAERAPGRTASADLAMLKAEV